MNNAPTSICILRLSAIGDCVNALATIQAIQREFPNASITWITGKGESKLFKNIPNIEIIPFAKSQGITECFRIRKLLANRVFDVLLDMQSALRASILSLIGIKAKKKYGFDAVRAMDGQQFFTNCKVKSPEFPHVLDGFMAFASAIGVKDLTPSWNFYLAPEDFKIADRFIDPKNKYIILTPCTSKEYKNWTVSGYTEICRYALQEGFHILICGSANAMEKEMAEMIIENLHIFKENVLDLTGLTNLREMMAVISRASMLISPDSGPIHMANAAGIPVLGLYAHHNPDRVGPRNYLQYTVSVYKECIAEEHPEEKNLPWRTRVHDKLAMNKISTKDVKKAFDRIVSDFNLLSTNNVQEKK